MEVPLTQGKSWHHLNKKLYVDQDLPGLLLKKQNNLGQGEIYQSCKDYF